MMKFFRKHNKKLIAIFMSLLMIVFVGGVGLERMLTPGRNQVVADSALGPISLFDQGYAQETTGILEALNQNWRQPAGVASTPITETDWVLLIREAEKLGTPPPAASARNLLASPYGASIKLVAHRRRMKSARVLEALADLQAIRSTARSVAGAASPSEAEIRAVARDALDKVKINAVLLPASVFASEDAEFSDAETESHFAAYAGKEAGEGMDFGYHVPPTVRVQYVHIDPEAISETIVVAGLDRKARAFFDQNRTTNRLFQKPPKDEGDEDADDEEFVGPPTLEQELEDDSPFMKWEDAREIAIRSVKNKHAKEAVNRIAERTLHYTGETWAQAQRGPDGYRVAPAECAKLDYFDVVIERLRGNIDYPGALSTVTTEFFSADDVGELPGIGAALFRPKQGLSKSLRTLAFLTKGLVPEIPSGEGVTRADYTAMFQPSQYPLTGAAGSTFLFRVIDARESHRPESVDEVRDRVVDDLRLLRGFEAAREHAEMLQINAISLGLKGAYDEDQELVDLLEEGEQPTSGHLTPAPFARVSRYTAARGRPELGTYVSGGLGRLPNEIVDQCFVLEESNERVAVMNLDDRAAVLVVEWVETQRGRIDEFAEFREQLATQMAEFRYRAALVEWLDPENIRTRNGFVPAGSGNSRQ